MPLEYGENELDSHGQEQKYTPVVDERQVSVLHDTYICLFIDPPIHYELSQEFHTTSTTYFLQSSSQSNHKLIGLWLL